jgi:hypothetical protein
MELSVSIWQRQYREEDRQPRIMDRQKEHEVRVQLGRESGVRLINEARERTRLQIIELSRKVQEREAKEAERADFERRVDVQFNNQAKYICNWLQRTIKRSIFCRNFANSWNNFCNRKIAGLKVLIFWRSWKIKQYMKKK